MAKPDRNHGQKKAVVDGTRSAIRQSMRCGSILSGWTAPIFVYLGRTDRTLAKRIGEFARFGSGQPVGHWGGRLIWQLPRPDLLMIGWLALDAGLAIERERALLAEFVATFDRLPFANLRK